MAALMSIHGLRLGLGIRTSNLVLHGRSHLTRCAHQQQRFVQSSRPIYKSIRSSPFLTAFKTKQPQTPTRLQSTIASSASIAPGLLDALSTSSTSTSSTSSWPQVSSPAVGYWLLASAASVFGIVIFGGLTRLTESGLSITEWRPVTGSFPPTTATAWESEFALYRQSPEFKLLNSRMNLDEFKQIYWMEWGHRLWGRAVGITFLLPTIYFIARRRVSRHMAPRLVGISALIGFQGFIGWWMVKSGLKDDLLETGSHPRVSQYRLTAHLGTAFAAYLCMLWNGLQVFRERAAVRDPIKAQLKVDALKSPQLKTFRRSVAGLSVLVFVTAMSGALVAGLDAGMVYNDFPWMGRPNFFPPKRELMDPFYSHTADRADLLWRNMFENPVTAQLDHRVMATTTFCAVLALWAYSRFNPRVRAALPRDVQKSTFGIVHLVTLQVVLGISTLWYLVPTYLASAHQAGALALLTGVFILGGRVWVPQRSVALIRRALEAQRKAPSNASARTIPMCAEKTAILP